MDEAGWDDRYSETDYVWSVTANQFVDRHLRDLDPGTAIDLGAGEGRNAVWLAQQGWAVAAIDFSRTGLEKAQQLATDHDVVIECIHRDALVFEPEGQVDLVLISYLQLPSDQRVDMLRRAATWVAPGGTLFVIAHDQANVSHGYGGPSSVHVCYDADETVEAVDGLVVVRASIVERVVETPDGPRTALDTLVIATRPV